jgi:hypothetical protein|tara:strand:- start:1530 stop:1868 length:339 start_codon:yes stop_codon:yes gene_type:complete
MENKLLNTLKEMAREEKKVKAFKKRFRFKGRVTKKEKTKNGNLKLTLKHDPDQFSFIILKSHKERFALAEQLKLKESVSVVSIPKFRMSICTSLKRIKALDESKQQEIDMYT